ncbi:MAG: ABC transporter substrate-binding protein, partial [Actinomycetales bacterium]|nr:ABC transporter substrate-binding protein [Actinomycetales bacterium]
MLPTRRTFLVTGGAAALTLSACSGGNSGSSGNGAGTDGEATGGGTLVIDTAFSIETGDPGHTYDPTGNMVAKAIYEP